MQVMHFTMKQILEISGGITNTVFPEVEHLLNKSTVYYKALKYIASRKDMTLYESVMDFIFCELHPGWRNRCRKYYLSGKEEDQLKSLINSKQRDEFCRRMLQALEIAKRQWEEQMRRSWSWLVTEMKKAA